ncbi:hypothetical protein LTS08_006967 [Lithohypha guttulata]|uniref:Uncharacterized protein n=1 Tax=Lithohypha guttulata TaxID=1690604 RepID=A0AAN7TAF6_9EURO|nr:hypothetical protein LTR51_002017 [Lithohypha guttulata]KAK5090251.1 hypothetical protein LTR05_000422 [Lithohypha guttulata]KAK5097553.1 hypothetical protein LTS08_006967 [Lithohypha guttulata]
MTSDPKTTTPVSGILTVVITTSPTPSAPSTELLSLVFQSFQKYCPSLLECRLIVVLDTYDKVAETPRLKRGVVTAQIACDFELYKANVKELVLAKYLEHQSHVSATRSSGEAEYGSAGCEDNVVNVSICQFYDERVTFIEPVQRLGFGLAVRSALRIVKTPYVHVHQHDWTLEVDIPVASILDVMQAHESDINIPVKYICLPSIRLLEYATQDDVVRFLTLRELTSSLKRDFIPSPLQGISVPLTPLFFWHDKPHIASTKHYLACIFPSTLAMPRGAFIEDTVGQRARTQMKEGKWHKWACWLYYPAEGRQLCLRHLKGRVWRGVEAEMKQKEIWKAQNAGAEPLEDIAVVAEVNLENLFSSQLLL